MPDQFPANSLEIAPAFSRRRFLGFGAACALALLARPAAAAKSAASAPKRLAFHNLHTGERLETTFWANGGLIHEAHAEISYLLRDHRTDEVKAIDPKLLGLLYVLKQKAAARQAFQVISGYRSPRTNAALRSHSTGVATHSLHIEGQAIDIALPGCRLDRLRQLALSLRGGGVGYYPGPGFIHLDTGLVRQWS